MKKKKPLGYHGEWSPLEGKKPSGPSTLLVFGLGTTLGTPFTTIPPWLFQRISHSSDLSFAGLHLLVCSFHNVDHKLSAGDHADITVVNTMDKKKHFKSLIGKAKKRQLSTWVDIFFTSIIHFYQKYLYFFLYLNFKAALSSSRSLV